jgi:hypothetical protein
MSELRTRPGSVSRRRSRRSRVVLAALALGGAIALIPIAPVLAGPSAKISGSVSTLDADNCAISIKGSGLETETEYSVLWTAVSLDGGMHITSDVILDVETDWRGRLQASANSALAETSRDVAEFRVEISDSDSNVAARGSIKNNCKAPPTVKDRGYFCAATQKFYTFSSTAMNWADARDAAPRRGYLAEINSAAENACVVAARDAALPEQFDIWIGATDGPLDVDEGNWKWQNSGVLFWLGNESGAPVADAYENWKFIDDDPTGLKQEPNDSGGEDCAHLWELGTWNDSACSNSYFAVYESR